MKPTLQIQLAGLGLAAVIALWGCASDRHDRATMPGRAVADLEPTKDSKASGKVSFIQVSGGTRAVADVTGLPPGEHGFHIHEKGDCSAPDAMSAGGHFNPTGQKHGSPDAAEHHIGDMGNLVADASGKAHMDRTFKGMELMGTNSIIGRGLILHVGQDDFVTQPTGNAGARAACGVIRATQQ